MTFTVKSPQQTTYALATTDSIAICGTTDQFLDKIWSKSGTGHYSGGDPGIGGADEFSSIPIGDWSAGNVSASDQGARHTHVWFRVTSSGAIVWNGARNFDIVLPGSGSASGSSVVSTGACPPTFLPVAAERQALAAYAASAYTSSGGAVVITDAAPKYYRVHFHEASLQLPEPAASLLAGGLLRLSAVTLQYDLAWSLPMQAVWTCPCSPEKPGWMLSVTREANGRLHAVLALSRQGAMQVKAPFAWASDEWAFGSYQWLKWCGIPHDVGLPSIALEPVIT